MGDVNAVYTLECAHRPQLLSALALNERHLLIRQLTIPPHKDDWGRYTLMTLSFFVFCNIQTCMSIRRPSKCSAPMPCTTSCRCPLMRVSLAVHTREGSGKNVWMAFQAQSDYLLNAEFSSCSSRCWSLLWA